MAYFFCRLLIFFSKLTFSKNSFANNIRVSNSLDPDQARQNVTPDLGLHSLQTLSAEDSKKVNIRNGDKIS